MDLEILRDKVKDFDQKVSWDKTELKEIITFMEQELKSLKDANPADQDRINHLLTDLLMLILQTSYRYNTHFDVEVEKWFIEMEESLKT